MDSMPPHINLPVLSAELFGPVLQSYLAALLQRYLS
jgi:hypothetical protein